MQKITYVSEGDDGHRAEYNRLFMTIFQDMRVHVDCVAVVRQAKENKAPLFYAMFDNGSVRTFSALLRAIIRSFLGRRTVGLFFRPATCLHATDLKHRIKRLLFRFTAHLPHVSILTILPFDLCPGFSTIATNGIFDPQLWDLHYLKEPSDGASDLKRHITSMAQGRRLVVALGGQNYEKGFDCMVDLWCSSPKIRDAFLFVAAGKVSVASMGKAKKFEDDGGFLLNTRIGNDQLLGLYAITDRVWTCYAPQYNHASGIHGRAVQLGVPVVVREGSYLEKLGELIGHPTLALDFDDPQKAADNLLAWRPSHTDEEIRAKMVTKMREHSLAVLAEAIGAVIPAQVVNLRNNETP